jgi:tetratricopeptide (TPR) repeat protein/TolB-like protein
MADGLETAHQAGILHRDLKPGNLRLSKDGRLKILDFGLAEWTNPEGEAEPTVTNTKVSGTVAYMAPELLRGKKADARTDIYAAGAVLYEMATGKHPYAETSGPQLIAQILDQPPSRPTSRNRRISPILETIILKALDRDPDRRYQSSREMKIDLERLSTGSGPVVVSRRRTWPWMAGVAAALAIAGALLLVPGIRERIFGSKVETPHARARRSVAVMGFRNLSGKPDQAWLSTALEEMLSTELSSGGQLRCLPGENIARIRLDLSLPDTESYAPDTLGRIRKHSGTDLVVMGSYLAMGRESGDQLRVDFHLQDAATGETLTSVSETGTQPELLDLVARTGNRLRTALGIVGPPRENVTTRTSLPSGNEAARLYAEGLAKLRVFEALDARKLLEQAVKLEPDHALSHAALADALATLGYDSMAREQAKKAFELAGSLSPEDRSMVEGRLREMTRDWPKAVETYRALLQFFPDNPEYALRLAKAQTAAGQSKDAMQTLAQLRQANPAIGNDPRIDLAEAKALADLGNFQPAQEAAERAVRTGQSQGARLVVAQAKLDEGFSWERLGELEKAAGLFREARELFTAAGDRRGAASSAVSLENVLYDQGNYGPANELLLEALKTFRELGDRGDSARTLNALGNVAADLNKFSTAIDYYEQSESIYRETGDKAGLAGAVGNLANVYDSMGELAKAKKMNEECIVLFREVGNQRGTGSALGNLGNVLLEMGELAEARQRFEEGAKIQKEIGYRRGQGYGASNLADLLIAAGDMAEARRKAEEGLAIRKELGETVNVALSQQQLAEIALSDGRLDEAEGYLRASIPVLQKAGVLDNLIQNQAMLARVLLAKNKVSEAADLAASASKMAQSRPSNPPRFDATLALARVNLAGGKHDEALREAQDVLQQAKGRGYLGYQLEARLVEAQVLAKSGKQALAKTIADELRRDAHAGGYGRVEQEAQPGKF